MKLAKLFTIMIMGLCGLFATGLQAQEGDQILDGIGETALTARYVLDGDLRDWSRNNLHAAQNGTKVDFVKDDVFGKVARLSQGDVNGIELPGKLVTTAESLSISGWFSLGSAEEAYLVDFGTNEQNHFSIGVFDGNLIAKVATTNKVIQAKKDDIKSKQWHHFAVIYNIVSSNFELYVDGKLEDTSKISNKGILQLLGIQSTNNADFYIGQPLSGDERKDNVKLYDFRIYHVALSEQQVQRIYRAAIQGEAVVNERQGDDDKLPEFDANTPQLFNAYLHSVEDIEVTTSIGELPRLPSYVKARYNQGIDKKKVRVIWPAPKDNQKVQKVGTYTVVGKIPGTSFQPKAVVTVKELSKEAPKRVLASFKLSQVQLNKDSHGQQTKFIENRDKFINTLAKTDPDSFLYMFRNAFGVAQPQGAKPLGVWDSQETKLRGHATGHYLSAIAQAYASSTYNEQLQETFAQKMNYMVETLYELSKLSGQ